MIQTLTPTNGGIPVAADSCMMCVGTAARWTCFYTRPATLCNAHFREWAAEKAD